MIQLIAVLTMLVDHLGIVYFPDNEGMRIVGRVAFPIYVYLLVIGYQRTRNVKRYMIRLSTLALLSQLPFMYALNLKSINVIATLCLCLLALLIIDRVAQRSLMIAAVLSILLLLDLLPFDYGAYALFLVLMYRFIPKAWWIPVHIVLNIAFMFYSGWLLQHYSVFGTIVILSLLQLDKFRLPTWLWRSFYPVHLLILAVLWK